MCIVQCACTAFRESAGKQLSHCPRWGIPLFWLHGATIFLKCISPKFANCIFQIENLILLHIFLWVIALVGEFLRFWQLWCNNMNDGPTVLQKRRKNGIDTFECLAHCPITLSGLLKSCVFPTKSTKVREERDIAAYLYHNHNCPLWGEGPRKPFIWI